MAIYVGSESFTYRLTFEGITLEDADVEIHSRKNARKLAEAWGCMKAYRRRRLEIRHAEQARRARLKGGKGGAAGGAGFGEEQRHLRHLETAKHEKR